MPPSSKRRTRRRAAEPQDLSDADLPDSSPSRPATKKRRTNAATTPIPVNNDSTVESEPLKDEGASSEGDEVAESQEIVDSVIPFLAVAKEPVSVAIDHANTFIEREYKDGVQAYAKLAGREWTYYVKTLSVNIGRPPDTVSRPSVEDGAQSSPFPDFADTTRIQIDLGPSKVISRLHAELFFDMKDGKWHIIVNGRNGLRVNEMLIRRGQRTSLSSGDVIEIGGTQMMFVLPGERAVVHHTFIEAAQALANGEEPERWPHPPPPHPDRTAHMPPSDSSQGVPTSSRGSLGHVPLAPAPPDYKRHSTPASPRVPDGGNRPKQSPSYHRGFMLESTEDIDYSLDSAKDLKPPFSYATLISQAILSSPEEKLTLASIYQWIQEQYSFYRYSNSGWQNSIRHNLSLSKAFQKIPRRTDEPGKGMKWQIVPEHRHEFNNRGPRNTKGGGRGSSAPTSPAAKDNARGFGPSSSQAGLPDQSQDGLASSIQLKHSPRSTTPPLSSYPPAAKEAYTPERGSHLPHHLAHGFPQIVDDGSPLPRSRSAVYGLSDAAAAGSPPLLSSSAYYDEARSLVTPAPRRQNPKLAPPSTAHLPSTYMPTSSPAPFWKFADDGSTPARPMPDLSPLKTGGTTALGGLHSSSPPAASGSPSRLRNGPFTNSGMLLGNGLAAHDEEDESEGIDLARGFQPIGSFHRQMTNGTLGR